jgi:hypothetical protein
VRSTGRDHYALIEFVKDNTRESFLRDAKELRSWVPRALPEESHTL